MKDRGPNNQVINMRLDFPSFSFDLDILWYNRLLLSYMFYIVCNPISHY
jgi:hypothetical protein